MTLAERFEDLEKRVEKLEDQADGVIDVLELVAFILGYYFGAKIVDQFSSEDY